MRLRVPYPKIVLFGPKKIVIINLGDHSDKNQTVDNAMQMGTKIDDIAPKKYVEMSWACLMHSQEKEYVNARLVTRPYTTCIHLFGSHDVAKMSTLRFL